MYGHRVMQLAKHAYSVGVNQSEIVLDAEVTENVKARQIWEGTNVRA